MPPMAVSPLSAGAMQAAVVYPIDCRVARRPDSLGITVARKIVRVETELPLGGALDVGIFVIMPDRFGIGGAEPAAPEYARQTTGAWVTSVEGASVRRTNDAGLEWPVMSETIEAIGYGVWLGTELRAYGFLRDHGGNERRYEIVAGRPCALPRGSIGLVVR
jgi:hypothetical protein